MALLRTTQKTPKREIEKAKSYRDDFLKRSKKMNNKFEDFLNEQRGCGQNPGHLC